VTALECATDNVLRYSSSLSSVALLTQLALLVPQISVAYQTLDILQEHGIAANDIQKLQAAGYFTVESIAHATVRKLSDVKGISEAKVQKLVSKYVLPNDVVGGEFRRVLPSPVPISPCFV
jgi:hypothetical protein